MLGVPVHMTGEISIKVYQSLISPQLICWHTKNIAKFIHSSCQAEGKYQTDDESKTCNKIQNHLLMRPYHTFEWQRSRLQFSDTIWRLLGFIPMSNPRFLTTNVTSVQKSCVWQSAGDCCQLRVSLSASLHHTLERPDRKLGAALKSYDFLCISDIL